MPADIPPRAELVSLVDLHGHKVSAVPAGLRGDMLAVVTVIAVDDEELADGHPFLNREMAGRLGTALVAWATREGP